MFLALTSQGTGEQSWSAAVAAGYRPTSDNCMAVSDRITSTRLYYTGGP
ncbi:MAG: hypothetical protein J6B12_03545 [Clostridia bacterium]|nr:hypothetical protein [Clostridia bacterium]